MDAQGPNTFVPKEAQLFAFEGDTDEMARLVAEYATGGGNRNGGGGNRNGV
jgi:hypothetical protein